MEFQGIIGRFNPFFLGKDGSPFFFVDVEQFFDLAFGFVFGSDKILFFTTGCEECFLQFVHFAPVDFVISLFECFHLVACRVCRRSYQTGQFLQNFFFRQFSRSRNGFFTCRNFVCFDFCFRCFFCCNFSVRCFVCYNFLRRVFRCCFRSLSFFQSAVFFSWQISFVSVLHIQSHLGKG